jgi:hypothetical protein
MREIRIVEVIRNTAGLSLTEWKIQYRGWSNSQPWLGWKDLMETKRVFPGFKQNIKYFKSPEAARIEARNLICGNSQQLDKVVESYVVED